MFVDCIQFYQCALQHTMNPQNACHPRDDILGPRQSAIFIAGEAEDVIVKTEGLRAVANMVSIIIINAEQYIAFDHFRVTLRPPFPAPKKVHSFSLNSL